MNTPIRTLISCAFMLFLGCAATSPLNPAKLTQAATDAATEKAVEAAESAADGVAQMASNEIAEVRADVNDKLDAVREDIRQVKVDASQKPKTVVQRVVRSAPIKKAREIYNDDHLWDKMAELGAASDEHSARISNVIEQAAQVRRTLAMSVSVIEDLKKAQEDSTRDGAAGGAGIVGVLMVMFFGVRKAWRELQEAS